MDEPTEQPSRRVIGGRHGSPTITVAFPFANVNSFDTELRSALVELAGLVAGLADGDGDRDTIADSARELAARLRDDD